MSSGSGNISNVLNLGGGVLNSSTTNGITPAITIPLGNLSSLVTLVGGSSSVTNNDYYGFYSASSPASQAQYQVPSGKKLYVLGMYLSFASDHQIQLGYGTAALASEGTNTAPTGAIYYGASSTTTATPFTSPVANPNYSYFPVGFSFPALSYPFWKPENNLAEYRVVLLCIAQ